MKAQNENMDDAELLKMVQAARLDPDLPPGFQDAVWRRLERADAAQSAKVSWLDSLVAWIVRPRLALAGVTAMLLLGVTLGVMQGVSLSDHAAKARYLAAVSPNPLH
jgi:hypothetical protein